MKFLIFFTFFLVSRISAELLTDVKLEDFKDPLESPDLQDAIRKMLENTTDFQREGRIVGGNVAMRGDFPYTVALHIRTREGMFICGGSLIRYNWVLTAAHCIDNSNQVQVIIGAVNRIHGPAVFHTTVTRSRDLIMHPRYNRRTFQNDIALIRIPNVNESILHSRYAGLIQLPQADDHNVNLVGQVANVSGFGLLGDGRPPSEVLRFVAVPIISNDVCGRTFRNGIQPSNICVATTGGRSPCRGDSGGPLTLQMDSQRSVVVGVVSFGAELCGAGYPVVFVRVSSFMPWIENTMNAGSHMGMDRSLGFVIVAIFLMRKFYENFK